ncbi:MAG: hypothetical protein LBI70_00220, partial [Rickettsiales bacterium]|nr:hypothetical protein [Rickettsiales bacterium]
MTSHQFFLPPRIFSTPRKDIQVYSLDFKIYIILGFSTNSLFSGDAITPGEDVFKIPETNQPDPSEN